jgi:tetratricopeptide (TPR) repeat protein
VLAEQKLGASELADVDARLRLGRILGASRMVFGGYFALGEEVQVTMRVVDTATSRVVLADEFSAPAPAVMARIETTAGRIAHALGGVSANGREYPAALWQAYDRALALSDVGQYEEAIAALQALLARQKDFTPAERQLVALLDKLSRR